MNWKIEAQTWKDRSGVTLGIPGLLAPRDRVDRSASVMVENFGAFYLLTNLYVPEVYRRRGCARALVASAIAWSLRDWTAYPDVPDFELYLNALPYAGRPVDAAALKAFYGSMGFEPVRGHRYAMQWRVIGQ